MAVSYVNGGAVAVGTTSAAVPQPASPAAGNVYIAHVGNKPFSAIPNEVAGWDVLAYGMSGAVANGVSTGSVAATAYRHDVTGSESGNVTFTVSSGSPTMGRMQQFSKASTRIWDIVATVLTDTDETGTGVSATGEAIEVASGDMLSFCVVVKDDAATHTRTGDGIDVPGCTLGSVTWETVDTTISGNDGLIYLGRCSVTAGTSSGAPTYTATSAVSGASSTAVSVVRLRDIDTPTYPYLLQMGRVHGPNASTTLTVTMPSTPTSGNLLVFCMAGDKNNGALTLAGWTITHSLTSTSVSLYQAYKVSDGTEATVVPTWATSSTSGNTAWVGEYAQTGSGSWELKGSASNITTEATEASKSTGTTGTISNPPGIAVACAGQDSEPTAPTVTWTNSFIYKYYAKGAGGRGTLGVAERPVTSATTYETTFSYTGGADQTSAAMLVLGRVVTAAATSRPVPRRDNIGALLQM
jgi:hypothetical protein